jgi:hypothetical protein
MLAVKAPLHLETLADHQNISPAALRTHSLPVTTLEHAAPTAQNLLDLDSKLPKTLMLRRRWPGTASSERLTSDKVTAVAQTLGRTPLQDWQGPCILCYKLSSIEPHIRTRSPSQKLPTRTAQLLTGLQCQQPRTMVQRNYNYASSSSLERVIRSTRQQQARHLRSALVL